MNTLGSSDCVCIALDVAAIIGIALYIRFFPPKSDAERQAEYDALTEEQKLVEDGKNPW